jgi:hypothetical protein
MCFAQGGGQRRGGFGRGGGYGTAQLVNRHDVQTDLALTADQIAKITEIRNSFRTPRNSGGAAGGAGTAGAATGAGTGFGAKATAPSAADQAARRARAADEQKQIEAVLTEDQIKRIKEIRIQLEGDLAVTEPDVQTQLDVTADQKAQIKKLQDGLRDANASVMQKMQDQSIDRTEGRATMQKNNDTMKAELHKLLTPAQVDKLSALGGKHFEADPNQGRGRRNRGGA